MRRGSHRPSLPVVRTGVSELPRSLARRQIFKTLPEDEKKYWHSRESTSLLTLRQLLGSAA